MSTTLAPPSPVFRAFAFEHAKKTVMMPLRPVDTHLVETVHVAVHSFPLPTATKRWWGRVRYRLHHSDDLGGNRDGTPIEEVACGNGLGGIVQRISSVEVNRPRRTTSVRSGCAVWAMFTLVRFSAQSLDVAMAGRPLVPWRGACRVRAPRRDIGHNRRSTSRSASRAFATFAKVSRVGL